MKPIYVCALLALGALFGAGNTAPLAWAQGGKKSIEKPEPTPQMLQMASDRKYTFWYIREYQKAQNRLWTFPGQISVMIKHGPDALAWCDACEQRWDFKNKTFTDPSDPQARLKDELRQSRAHIQALLARKDELAQELPGRLEKIVIEADLDSEKGAAQGLTEDFDKARKSLEKAQALVMLAQAVFPPDSPGLAKAQADVSQLEDRMRERQTRYWQGTRDKAKAPEESYKSPDLEEVRSLVTKAWQQAYPGDKLVRVIVPANANTRVTVARYSPETKNIEIQDISQLPVRVVVEAEPGYLWVYSAVLVKSGATAQPTLTPDVSMRGALTSPTDQIKKP